MGKQLSLDNQNSRHVFWVDGRGILFEAYGEHLENVNQLDVDCEPYADVTASRVLPGPADNNFFTYYTLSYYHVGGPDAGVRSVRWWGSNWQQADHWEGPWLSSTPQPAGRPRRASQVRPHHGEATPLPDGWDDVTDERAYQK